MAKSMSKSKIAAALAQKADIPKKASTAYLNALAALAQKDAKSGLTIPGVGKLVVHVHRRPSKAASRQKTLIARIARSPVPSLHASAIELGLSSSRAKQVDTLVARALNGRIKAAKSRTGPKKKRLS